MHAVNPLFRRRTIRSRVSLNSAVLALIAATTVSSVSRAADAATGLEYVPADSLAVISLRPADVLGQPPFESLAASIASDDSFPREFGLAISEIARLTIVPFNQPMANAPDSAGFVIRSTKAFDRQSVIDSVALSAKSKTADGIDYFASTRGRPAFVHIPNDQTIVLARDEATLFALAKAGPAGANDAAWTSAWKGIGDGHVAVMVNIPKVGEFMKRATEGVPPAVIETFAPLWQSGRHASISLRLGKDLKIDGAYQCDNTEGGQKVEAALNAGLNVVRLQLQQQLEALGNRPRGPQSAKLFTEIAEKLVGGVRVERGDADLSFGTRLDPSQLEELMPRVLAAVADDRKRALRQQAGNNLKQLALAMHNYHAVHGNFPPPSVVGPDGKTVHSWRVAILPYLGEQALYDSYKKDQPWNGPDNKKLLKAMPAVFRHSTVSDASTHSSYFVLTGPDTVFVGKKGTQIRDIRDGTSNTIMVVEAKRTVPWTKPVDIAYSANGKMPKLGGYDPLGFFAAFCDGSARFLLHDLGEETLRAVITLDGGEQVGPLQ